MQLLKDLRISKLKFHLAAHQEQYQIYIERFIKEFGSKLLEKIFSESLDKDKFTVLKSNTLRAKFVTINNETGFFIFSFSNSDMPGVHYSEERLFNINIGKMLTEIELNGDDVHYGLQFNFDNFFTNFSESIDKAIENYIENFNKRK